ncbi:hypothetical protein DFQ27_003288 [Actinomortierella ambigua]|uniref:Uncharacterized protein n=1 Tax=Actinomortierella ambigua TaxID=1343610 RepID=A0A9P6U5R4_9FUNG|nr:hypothetical protein DFQ27_003288 [Actinomortierella ambigua]
MLLSKSLLLLCSAVAVMARQTTRAIASGAIFVGQDTTDPNASPVNIFKHPGNHAAAVSSVVAFSAKRESFTPAVAPAKSLEVPLQNFLRRVSTFPGFLLTRQELSSDKISGSLIQFEKVVRDSAYKHGALIGRGMRDLVPGYIPDKSMDQWILNLVVIDKAANSDVVELQLLYVALEIKTDDHHSAIIPEQQIRINRSILEVNQSYLTQYADSLVEKISIAMVRDTIDLLASPKDLSGEEIFAATCHAMF